MRCYTVLNQVKVTLQTVECRIVNTDTQQQYISLVSRNLADQKLQDQQKSWEEKLKSIRLDIEARHLSTNLLVVVSPLS